GDELSSGLPIPNTYFVDAVSTNDVNAQQRFYAPGTAERLDVFVRDGLHPERVARLRALRAGRATYRLLNQVERAKIELSVAHETKVDLTFLEPSQQLLKKPRLAVPARRGALARSSQRLLQHLGDLIGEVRRQAGTEPDVAYLTGGMARSVVVREHLKQVLGEVGYLDSDHFASVTQGLTLRSRALWGQPP
ncbi:MAG: hypothetical protein OES38_02680, partial [Gammaproteobacteria bacterium]|nr:hypothetical protein [Gammaproteobacteria bacterium]